MRADSRTRCSSTHGELSTATSVVQMSSLIPIRRHPPTLREHPSPWSPAPARASAKRPRKPLPDLAFTSSAWPAARTGSRRSPTRSAARQLWRTSLTARRSTRSRPRWTASTCWSTTPAAPRAWQPVADADLDDWRWMWETNVLGTLRVTRALLPKLIDSGDGLIVTVTSIAAFEIYDGGVGLHRRPSTRRRRCTRRCAASCSENRCGSPRLRREWSRPSSRSSDSAATRTAPTRSTGG